MKRYVVTYTLEVEAENEEAAYALALESGTVGEVFPSYVVRAPHYFFDDLDSLRVHEFDDVREAFAAADGRPVYHWEDGCSTLIERPVVRDAHHPIGYEARCTFCGETFNPHGPDDLIHVATLAGDECGGEGEMVGCWY